MAFSWLFRLVTCLFSCVPTHTHLVALVRLPHKTEEIAEEGSEDRAIMDTFLRRLESAWQAAVAKFTPPPTAAATATASSAADAAAGAAGMAAGAAGKADVFMGALVTPPETLDGVFALLAQWRTELSPRLGPLFSDPLRVLKKAMIKAQKTEAAAAAAAAEQETAAAATASAGAGAGAGKKDKGSKGKGGAPSGGEGPATKRARA